MELQRIQKLIQMYSPIQHNHQSPFNSIRNSLASTANNNNSRPTSVNKPINIQQNANQMVRVPSNKKLSLTYQAAQFKPQKVTQDADQELKKRTITASNMKGRFVSLQTSMVNEKIVDDKQMANDSVMKYFHQQMQSLKNQYGCSLKHYELRIDELQRQLNRNSIQLQEKNNQITHLEQIVKRMQIKNNKAQPFLQRKIEDVQTKLKILTQYAQESFKDTQQNIDTLTNKIINCFGGRISALRRQYIEFMNFSLSKINSIEQKIEAKEKQESVGTRQSINMQQISDKIQGISFFDDCFFYPTPQRSENCGLIAQMGSKRSEPFSCWIDSEGYLRYCDSGSFFFNRKGDKIGLQYNELLWLQEHRMVKII